MRSALAGEYRVAPDRRFLKAFGDLDHLLSGRPPFTATATWRAGRWEIAHDGRVLATWSDPPTWDEAMASLAAYARSAVPERSTVPASEIDSIDDGDLFAALRDADAKWKASHDPSLLVPASRAYALLTLQSLDWMGVGDALASKAIAVMAAAKALTSADMSETETILAASTGYVGAAEGIARRLAETNPVRQWASDEKKIAAWARSSSSPLVQYLGQLTVAQRGNESQWLAWIATQKPPSGTIATAKAALTLHAFAEESQWTLALAGATLDEVKKGKTSRWNGDPAQLDAMVNDLETFPELRSTSLCDRFEEQLSTASTSLDGPILDRDSFGAFYRAAFYTGLFRYGLHLLDSLSSAEAAADFDRVIGRPRAPLPARLSAWFVILTARKSGTASLLGPLLDLESPDILGTIPLSRTFEEVRHAAAYDDATVYAAARAFFRHIDSRPSDRLAAARIADTILLDMPLHDRLEETAMRDGETSGIRRLALAEIAGDTAALRAIVADPAMRARDRAEAANGLNIGGKLDEKQYRAAMTPILAVSEPDQEWELQKQYAMHLADHGARAAAEAVVTSWLRDNPHAEAFTRYDATTVLSRLHLEDGDTQKAWSDVQPGLDAFKQSSVGQAAMVLEAMGRHQEARALAVRNVERYRDSAPARITLAAILWRQRQDRDAAAALVEPGYPLNSWEWRSAGSEFLKTLDNAPRSRVDAAWSELRHKANAFDLQEFIVPIGRAGKNQLAFELQSLLKTDGLGQVDLFLRAHDHLSKSAGPAKATAWLQSAVPPAMREPASMIIYPDHDLELLWSLVGKPSSAEDFVWLMRACAATKSPAIAKAHGDEIRAYFAGSHTGDYVLLGRYMLGLADEASVLQLATTPKRRCEIAYYIGAKAAAERRQADAVAWFRIACETGQTRNGEFRWAKDALLRMENRRQRFEDLH